VLASRDHREVDPRIDPKLKRELRPLPFKGYTLLGVDACRFQTGDQCAMEIPGDGYLQIQTAEATPHYLKIKLLLVQGNRPILNAEVKLNRNSSLLLKSASTGMGTILLSIKAPDLSDQAGKVETVQSELGADATSK